MYILPVALAYAQGEGGGGPASGIVSFLPLIILFLIFYFLLIRPQQKRAKEHKQMVAELQKGDQVVTSGGMHGRVTSVSEETITVEVSDGVRIKFSRESVAARKPQG